MHKTMKRWLAAVLAGLCLLGCSCGKSPTNDKDAPGDADAPAHTLVNGHRINFVPEETKQTWVASIAEMLETSLEANAAWEQEGGYPYPSDSDIPSSIYCCLFDVNLDGVAELLLFPRGYSGSSGSATYFVFDIETHAQVGEIYGGFDGEWCVYYSTRMERPDPIGQYWWRFGWDRRSRYVATIVQNPETQQYENAQYLKVSLAVEELLEDGGDPTAYYYIRHEQVSMDAYYNAYDAFLTDYVRIPETALVLFRWNEVSEETDSIEEKARKMAQALTSSGQEFILP